MTVQETENIRLKYNRELETFKMTLAEESEKAKRRSALVSRYLFQLQDAVEALWFRLNNLSAQGGRAVMDKTYFEMTTLYALGRVLASERILALEGVYPQLNVNL